MGQRNRERSKRFKHANPKLFRLLKTAGIVVLLWIVLLAPWPLLR
jgi:beta-hydroxylase